MNTVIWTTVIILGLMFFGLIGLTDKGKKLISKIKEKFNKQ